MALRVAVEPLPLLDARAFTTRFPAPLAEVDGAPLLPLLSGEAPAPVRAEDGARTAIRDLLRVGGFKPSGRSKPASEYLLGAAGTGRLGPINPAVDACNAVSLHSLLPISVIDLELAAEPLRIRVAGADESYVFNPSGQELDLSGLLVLADAAGPCASPVKDSQRTKTHPGTTRTLSIVWGSAALPGAVDAAVAWYRALLEALGASTEPVALG